jgi:hypothetical protein
MNPTQRTASRHSAPPCSAPQRDAPGCSRAIAEAAETLARLEADLERVGARIEAGHAAIVARRQWPVAGG